MSEINGIKPTGAPRPVPPAAPSKASKAQPSSQPRDTVEISPEAQIRSHLADMPAERADLVARVRAEIEAGTYETDEKLNIAIDRLMDELSL